MFTDFRKFLILKGLQPVTVAGHINGIRRIIKRIGTLTPSVKQAEDFICELYMSEYSHSHKSNSATSLEYYMEYLQTPIKFGRQRKPKRLIKETLNESEVNRMLLACINSRERAIVSLIAYAGLRPKEVCQLKRKDIDLNINQIRVELGKGVKDGNVFIPGVCVQVLAQYLQDYPRLPDDYLFYTLDRNAKYNQGCLRKLCKILARRAKITKRVYPYLFRHSLGINLVLRGADLLYVKSHFRHAFVESTMVYVDSISTSQRHEQFIPHYL